ncbi:MAG: response regulator transcription factor [Candidatus Eremiobacteraeota bacterium]|nr:response regulator transcription factor [Candidatus Eremiobacteraeota bacterium]MCW5867026.1 response regulator transcription factor [Candidatus Eremiobacteraeota bacterium]
MSRIKIALVDDDERCRRSLCQTLAGQEDFELTAACGSAEELLEQIEADLPQVILVDLGLPGMGGQELIRRLNQSHPEIDCIAHTIFEEPATVLAALRAGAAGYLLKGCTPAELLRSLRTLSEGGAPLTARIARLLIREVQPSHDPLSDREHEVLKALSDGFSYKEVASQLVVSSHTVHTHVKNIYEKLQVSGRRQALDKARQQGWL